MSRSALAIGAALLVGCAISHTPACARRVRDAGAPEDGAPLPPFPDWIEHVGDEATDRPPRHGGCP